MRCTLIRMRVKFFDPYFQAPPDLQASHRWWIINFEDFWFAHLGMAHPVPHFQPKM